MPNDQRIFEDKPPGTELPAISRHPQPPISNEFQIKIKTHLKFQTRIQKLISTVNFNDEFQMFQVLKRHSSPDSMLKYSNFQSKKMVQTRA